MQRSLETYESDKYVSRLLFGAALRPRMLSLLGPIRFLVRGFFATNQFSFLLRIRVLEKNILISGTRDIDTACLCPRHRSPLVILPKAFPAISLGR